MDVDVRNAVWDALAQLRAEHANDHNVQWVLLDPVESNGADLCGGIISRKGFIFRKQLAQVLVTCDGEELAVQVWKPRRGAVTTFTTDSIGDFEDIAQRTSEAFAEVFTKLKELADARRLEKEFPAEWIGPSVLEVYRAAKEAQQRNRQ
ncbi:MAG: hypothetical protein GC200_12155 [Tepidisphaera sp.]|nr:hypothetical protein [Tepidisphaera sp.]